MQYQYPNIVFIVGLCKHRKVVDITRTIAQDKYDLLGTPSSANYLHFLLPFQVPFADKLRIAHLWAYKCIRGTNTALNLNQKIMTGEFE